MTVEIEGARKAARLAIVQEHVRTEGSHELDALVDTFGEDPEWIDHSAGRSSGSQRHPSTLR